MTEPNVHGTDPLRLSRLWQCDSDALVEWQPDELAAIFKHLLASPLVDEVAAVQPRLAEKLRLCEAVPGERLDTFGDLLTHEQPPLDALDVVKEFCKHAEDNESLPPDVAFVLYAAVISVALVRRDERITSADDRSLQTRIKWAGSRDWIDPDMKALFEGALARLS
ncbi:MAG: hypothetical protein H8E44_04125 [Planctomycetes bacterium]|nr:hypothetical protein [Planctomycetota bacterium]MBL7042270.1 hypothetical protein [Pirellulaceae bacterium]